jgi:hypothetical protein
VFSTGRSCYIHYYHLSSFTRIYYHSLATHGQFLVWAVFPTFLTIWLSHFTTYPFSTVLSVSSVWFPFYIFFYIYIYILFVCKFAICSTMEQWANALQGDLVQSDHPVMILLYVLCVILVGAATRLHRCVLLGLKAMFIVVFNWCLMGCLV